MMRDNQHIILIGFKHVGKSTLARKLATRLQRPYIDLDQEMERAFTQQTQKKLSCRQIMQQYGQEFFRQLETTTLRQIIKRAPCILALGGGTPLTADNQQLIKPHVLIHVTGSPDDVYKRIMRKGLPAFFSAQEDPRVTFDRLWREREKIYTELTPHCVNNTESLLDAVEQTLLYLSNEN